MATGLSRVTIVAPRSRVDIALPTDGVAALARQHLGAALPAEGAGFGPDSAGNDTGEAGMAGGTNPARPALRPRAGQRHATLTHPLNRYVAGLPAGVLAHALGLGGGSYALDAACASSLFAVALAAEELRAGRADAMLTGGRQLGRREWVGLFIGFAGIVVLVWPDITAGGIGARNFALGVASLQVACAGWAIGSAYTRRHVMPKDVFGSAALQMFFGGMFMLAAGTASGEWSMLAFNPRTTAALVYLTLVGAVIAFAAYSYALKHLDMAVVSLYSYVNPVIAVALGALILDEPFNVRMAIAIGIIAVGVMVVGPMTRKTS